MPFVPPRAHSVFYDWYINSVQWKELSRWCIIHAGYKCQRCRRTQTVHRRLSTHHKTYIRLGRERLSDLVVLCPDCHEVADILRRIRTGAYYEYDPAQLNLPGVA